MRIHIWPALVCGWVLAAMAGQTALAQRPADELSGAVSQADAIDESDADYDASDAGGMPGGGINPARTLRMALSANSAFCSG